MEHKGKFIVIEGIEGSGKTVQTELLTQHFLQKNIPVFKTREASDGPIGKVIRQEYLSGNRHADNRLLNLLYVADRLDHITNDKDGILDIVNSGTNVISDRYYLSSAAYHASFYTNSYESEEAMKDIIQKNMINRDLLKPDITIFIDIDPAIAYDRVSSRGSEKEIFDDLHLLRNIKYCYERSIEYLKNMGDVIYIIDGNDDPLKVSQKIISMLDLAIMDVK